VFYYPARWGSCLSDSPSRSGNRTQSNAISEASYGCQGEIPGTHHHSSLPVPKPVCVPVCRQAGEGQAGGRQEGAACNKAHVPRITRWLDLPVWTTMVSPDAISWGTCLPRPAKVRCRPAARSKNWCKRSSRFFLAMVGERKWDETDGTLRANPRPCDHAACGVRDAPPRDR